jgi:hypothetical protein
MSTSRRVGITTIWPQWSIALPGMTPEALSQAMHECNRQMNAWSLLLPKAIRTLRRTRDPTAAMFVWQSNINYRNVASAGQERAVRVLIASGNSSSTSRMRGYR